MHLGIRSRKTGLNVKQGLRKDEYSMENIDDFFSDDSTSQIGDRRKSRRSSMLSLLSNSNSLPLPPSIEQQQEGQRFKARSSSSRRSSKLYRFSPSEHDLIEEEPSLEAPLGNSPSVAPSPLRQKIEAPLDGPSIRLTPEKSAIADVPDLVEDDEDTRDYTSFNTSENALLEDEMDDDYEVISEEDRDYVVGESSLEQTSDSSSQSDENSGNESENEISEAESMISDDDATISLAARRTYGYDDVPPEVYDSDEEYIQKQARELVEDKDATNNNSLRRSSRVKIAPLEWWRNEKVVYKRKSNKPVLEIDKIITYDKKGEEEEEEEELGRQRRKKKLTTRTRPYNYIPTGKPRGRPRKHKPSNMQDFSNPNTDLLEEINEGKVPSGEWLKHGILEANVNVTMDKKGDQIIAFAPNLAQSEQIKETEDEHFSLEVMFDKHKEHFASGILKLPRNGNKKLSDSYNTFITFFVVQGVVEITLAGNTFISTDGSTFQVPAFNEYSFHNRGNNEVRMFFTQVTVSGDELHVSTNESSDDEMQSQLLTGGEDITGAGNKDSVITSSKITSSRRDTLSSMIISDI